MKISKEEFSFYLDSIKLQQQKDLENAQLLGKVYPAFEANLMYDNSILVKALIRLLEKLTRDDNKTIEYFIYELNWGSDGDKFCIKDSFRGKQWNLKSVDDLYEYLKFYY
jgi:hypothetical protein